MRYRLADARVPAEPSKARSAAASDSIASKFHGASQEVKDAMEQMKFDGSFQARPYSPAFLAVGDDLHRIGSLRGRETHR